LSRIPTASFFNRCSALRPISLTELHLNCPTTKLCNSVWLTGLAKSLPA
jgi:hypothetical protein